MRITKGVISRDEANKIVPHYVRFIEKKSDILGFLDSFNKSVKPRRVAVTFNDGKYILGRISSVDRNSYQAIDGPVVRFTNGEYSWRVDGNGYAGITGGKV